MSDTSSWRILIMADEVEPFVRAAEIDGVIGSLARALHALGHDVRVAMPRYLSVDAQQWGLREVVPPFDVPMGDRLVRATAYVTSVGAGVPVYMLDAQKYLRADSDLLHLEQAERFVFYARATLELLKQPSLAWQPDIIHCHDWPTGIVPNWLTTLYRADPFYAHTATVFTIHRLQEQGIYGYQVLQLAGLDKLGFIPRADLPELSDLVDLTARGIYYSDMVTTDSAHYAQEIQTAELGERLDPLLREKRERLVGILNGLDPEAFDPRTDPALPAAFDVSTLPARQGNKAALQRAWGLTEDADTPLLGMFSPLTDDKGFDLVATLLPVLLANLNVQLAVVGSGEDEYEHLMEQAARRYRGRVVWQAQHDEALARRMYGGCDMLLMPSLTEPCSLCPMVALRYGCVPVARATGILADVVHNYQPATRQGVGFTFDVPDYLALYTAIVRAVEVYGHRDLWAAVQRQCMTADFSWERPVAQYVEVYRQARRHHEKALSAA